MIQTEAIPTARNMVLRKQLTGCRPGGGCCSECAGHHLGDDTTTDPLSLLPVMYNPATNVYGPLAPGEDPLPLFSTAPTSSLLASSVGVPAAPDTAAGSLFSTGTVLVMAGIGAILLLVEAQQGGRKRRR